jgi:3-oxocholest-4-en-26-oyl-CoA dehydrogenase alpha subunit
VVRVTVAVDLSAAKLRLECGDVRQLRVGEPFEFAWRERVLETIGGGTSEIMRRVVARRALHLGG